MFTSQVLLMSPRPKVAWSGILSPMPIEGDQEVLAVYVVWHPLYPDGPRLADTMFKQTCADPFFPAVRGLGIPVRFRTSTSSEVLPDPVPFDAAQNTAVVVLVDDEMAASGWDSYLVDLLDSATAIQSCIVIPVALTRNALSLPAASNYQFFRLYNEAPSLRETRLQNKVTHDLCRLLATEQGKVQVFISHAKEDGVSIARDVQRHLHEQAGIADFFDATDIPDGSRFADVIGDAIGASAALLSVQTDAYGSREWCRLEVLEAKRRKVPILVLTAIEQGEIRSFPYIGNVPVVRWQGNTAASMERVVGALLREVLRARYFPLRVREICREHTVVLEREAFVYPPELLTALLLHVESAGSPIGRYLYPDPPLGNEELELLRHLDPTLEPITPTALAAL